MILRRRTWLVRGLFVFAVLLIPAQFALISLGFGEPFPALMMPGFMGSRMTPDGVFSFESASLIVRFDDGPAVETSLRRLLSDLPSSHHWAAAQHVFRPSDPQPLPPQAERSWWKAWIISHLTPIRDRNAERRRAGNPLDHDSRLWLKRRLEVMYPARRASSIEFQWFRDSYRISGAGPTLSDRELVQQSLVSVQDVATTSR